MAILSCSLEVDRCATPVLCWSLSLEVRFSISFIRCRNVASSDAVYYPVSPGSFKGKLGNFRVLKLYEYCIMRLPPFALRIATAHFRAFLHVSSENSSAYKTPQPDSSAMQVALTILPLPYTNYVKKYDSPFSIKRVKWLIQFELALRRLTTVSTLLL